MDGWQSWLNAAPCFGNLTAKILMNTNQVGKLTELEVLTAVIKLGYSVSIPFGDKDRYDQVWDINGKLIRVQVKTSHWKDDNHMAILFKTKSSYGNITHRYTKEDIDYFATIWEGQLYLVPVEECSTEKTLWFDKPKNGCAKCAYAKDYVATEVLKQF